MFWGYVMGFVGVAIVFLFCLGACKLAKQADVDSDNWYHEQMLKEHNKDAY